MKPTEQTPEVQQLLARRQFVRRAAVGTAVVALGGTYLLAEEVLVRQARAENRKDGRPRLPPGQRLLRQLKPMGGAPGDPSKSAWRLKVHGEVDQPYEIDFRGLLALPQVDESLDVHCVTGWSVLGAKWSGVRIEELASRARVRPGARHVVFEAARGYTTNVPIKEALAPHNLIAHRLEGQPIARQHGAPVRGVVPDLYFWKSAKWITGIRFVKRDEPGYWETRGYHDHADPWTEERYS